MTENVILAAGCFWGIQYYFDQVPGVISTEVGYTGAKIENPSYEQVCHDATGHAEAVKVVYDPTKVDVETLFRQFFRMHNPTQLNRQGPDIGDQYRSAIFYTDEQQKSSAQKIIDKLNLEQFDGKIVTTLEPATVFWPAEAYHQKFTERTGRGMCHIPYAPI